MRPRILVICSANQCRSPMAAALLGRHLDEVGVDAFVMSAGVRCGTGSQATEPAIRVMRERGLDISKHRSWELTAGHAAAADLVIGMAREHVREVAVLDSSVLPRAFTLKELVRRSSAARRRTQPLVEWLEALSASRDPESLLGESHADDVDDPIGGPLREYRETAAELDDLIGRLVRSAWPAG